MLKINSDVKNNKVYGNIISNNPKGRITNFQTLGNILNNGVSGSVSNNGVYGSLSDEYINPAYVYDEDALSLFNRMTGSPPEELKLLIDKTIRDYKACGYWDKCDVIVKFNLFDEQAGLLDWKGNCNAINVNGCAFTPYIGYQGDGISKVINTKFSRTRTGNLYTLNDAHIYRNFYQLSTAAASVMVGDGGGNGVGGLNVPANISNFTSYMRVNGSGVVAGQLQTAIGHDFRNRTSSTSMHSFVNGTTVNTTMGTYPLTSEEQYIFGIIWSNGGLFYRHNARTYGYSFGSNINDTIAEIVAEINNYFNSNVSSTF